MKKIIEEFDSIILAKNYNIPIGVINNPEREIAINNDKFMAIDNGEIVIAEITTPYQALWAELLYSSAQNQKALEKIALLTGHSVKQFKADLTRCVKVGDIERVRQLLAYTTQVALSKVLDPKIKFGRCIDNTRKGTFDYIEVTIAICYSFTDAKAFVKENKKAIFKMAVGAIERDPNFKRFGVPIGVLNLDSAFLSKDCLLHLNFGLKEA